MNQNQIQEKLSELCALAGESEIVEFKGPVGDNFPTDKIGEYFSALSNEANLSGVASAWLVFGIHDKSHAKIGTTYRTDQNRLNALKRQIADGSTSRLSFVEICTLETPRVILFHIPAAPQGIPIGWKGHYYARNGDALTSLNIEKIERIRNQSRSDWSKEVCPGATIEDLDVNAIQQARTLFKQRFPDIGTQVDHWDNKTFLNKAKVTIQGKITRAAIILLGKSEAEHFISPGVAKIRWLLKDSRGNDKDYLIQTCPFILTVNEIFSKVRNVLYRLEKREDLFPDEMLQYSPDLIYEALNNCIAHQDYILGCMINVVEKEDEIIFTNCGDFVPGSVEKVIQEDAPEERYRNSFLCNAMFNFRMVQTRGGGIRMMFNEQAKRFFPLPEYDLSNSKVKVRVIGKVLDMDYATLLARDENLTLEEIMMLDKVQKRKKLTEVEIKHLKKKDLIEGRRPNIYLSAKVAQMTGQKAAYTKFRGFDSAYYQDLMIQALKQHRRFSRKEFDDLLFQKLPDWMTDEQKKRKVGNLLYDLKRKEIIENTGSDRRPVWVLVVDSN